MIKWENIIACIYILATIVKDTIYGIDLVGVVEDISLGVAIYCSVLIIRLVLTYDDTIREWFHNEN